MEVVLLKHNSIFTKLYHQKPVPQLRGLISSSCFCENYCDWIDQINDAIHNTINYRLKPGRLLAARRARLKNEK